MLPFNMGVGAGASGVDTGDIGHSLRFRSGASAYLSRTFGTPTAQNTWTLSFWVKQAGSISTAAAGGLFLRRVDTQNFESIAFDPNGTDANKLGSFTRTTSGVNNRRASSDAVYRDPTSWQHVLVVKSASQASSAPAFYVNGVSINVPTRSSAGTPQDFLNTATQHLIGQDAQSAATADIYLARYCFVDGQALTPSSFGYFNTEINEWVSKSQSAVKAVVDAGGTNSFMLDFDDGTSLTTLGYDKSSKGNNWTLNNFSLTAGTSYDWMLDVPGNSFATLNPIRPGLTSYPLATLSDANLSYGGSSRSVFGSMEIPQTGKYAFAIYTPSSGTTDAIFGVGVSGQTGVADNPGFIGYMHSAQKYVNGSASAYGSAIGLNDTVEVLIDNGAVSFRRNGTAYAVAATMNSSYTYMPLLVCGASNSATYSIDFGQKGYAPPAGYLALCQRNMPDLAILNPELHFDVLLHTGGASTTQDVTGTMFQPDLAWIKCRNNAYSNMLFDSIRGATIPLFTDTNTAESVRNGQSFLSNGFRVDRQSGQETNFNTGTFVDWFWKAGGASVTNNAGSLTSYVSANVAAGVSIAYWNGNGVSNSATTIGHGLNAVPGMYIVKPRTGTYGWIVYHKDIGNNYALTLNLTNAKTPDGANKWWNATSPTSTVFTVGDSTTTNPSAMMMGYFFAEIPGFSKIFSYTGNGSTDGPFVYCGFKPKYVMVKRTDAADSGWMIQDSIRNPYNTNTETLTANAANAASAYATTNNYDYLSSGFKVRHDTGGGYSNASGGTYIGIAFADVPAKYALAR